MASSSGPRSRVSAGAPASSRDVAGSAPGTYAQRPGRSDLVKSLAVLSSTRFNVAESARMLHYHYNTMRYRVTKLERMLGEFADDAAATLRIGVALEVLRMYEISGDSLQALL